MLEGEYYLAGNILEESIITIIRSYCGSSDFFAVSFAVHQAVGPMKAMKTMPSMKTGKAMNKPEMARLIATECEIKPSVAAKIISRLADMAVAELKETGKFSLPGLVRFKTRLKPATKEETKPRVIFGKLCLVKAKPARTVVKAIPQFAIV